MILAGSVLNAGGESHFVLVMESLATWVVGAPTAFAAAFVFSFTVWAVFLLLSLAEVEPAGRRMALTAFRAVAAQSDHHHPGAGSTCRDGPVSLNRPLGG
jgi:hypothetical protein